MLRATGYWAQVYEVVKVAAQYKRTQRCRPEKGFFNTMEDGTRVKGKKLRTKRLWVVRLCIKRRATRRKKKKIHKLM